MKKYTIELSKDQMWLIAKCLEDVSRFASGQCELDNTVNEILANVPEEERRELKDDSKYLLRYVKLTLFPGLEREQYLSYNSTNFIGNTYQIYRSILHRLAVDDNMNNVYSSPTLPSGDMGSVKIKQKNEALGDIFAFKVKDYTTILVGRKEGNQFFVERGDGTRYSYDSARVTWFEKVN